MGVIGVKKERHMEAGLVFGQHCKAQIIESITVELQSAFFLSAWFGFSEKKSDNWVKRQPLEFKG